MKLQAIVLILAILATTTFAGPLAWAACQTACNVGYGVCLAGFGLTAGVALGPAAPAAVVTGAAGCSAVQGACMAACTPLLLAPTP